MPWDVERLKALAAERYKDTRLIVVGNREPYIHARDGEEIRCIRPAGGMTTALDPVMRACGGVWVGHGSGDADRETADEKGRLQVPPDHPSYTLRRVWLTKEEEEGYYYGFSNEGLWPLCHIAYTRPHFDPHDWEHYVKVNRKFADAVLEEAEGSRAIVFVQDYHFALLPRMLKNTRPDLFLMHFWHIPWPNREAFRICPWQDEILDGLLGNDILSFHIQYHCNNFLDTVDRAIEAKVDWERFSVTRGGKVTRVVPQAISIDPNLYPPLPPAEAKKEERQIRARFKLGRLPFLVGIDRVDYTKGIPERIRAVDRLLTLHPELKGKFTFLQAGPTSRIHIRAYRLLNEELNDLVDEVNWRHGSGAWKPIQLRREHLSPEQVYALYRISAGCVVSSLHDGMNLVAKEYVAARPDLRGVLVLSRFTGAAREMNDALQVNPYGIEEFAQALYRALTMGVDEQAQRMLRLRDQISENNVYKWAGLLLTEAAKMKDAR
ncbi:MAG: trehalose-6-phosphate synthase [Planctomycetota bacterium]